MTDDTARAEAVCAHPGCGLPKRLHGPSEAPNPTRLSQRFAVRPSGLLREAVYKMLRASLTDVDNVTLGDLSDNLAALAADEPVAVDVEIARLRAYPHAIDATDIGSDSYGRVGVCGFCRRQIFETGDYRGRWHHAARLREDAG